MVYWEFLIQQEGDQTWLPLETKQVEILEGRYRIAAHTSRVNTSIEIRVSHLVLDEMPPRRRVRKRKGRINDSGLVIIFPFMQLKPGQWEVRCSSDDVMGDLLGSGWQTVVQLQVLPKAEDDWDPDWSERTADRADADHPTIGGVTGCGSDSLVATDLSAEPPAPQQGADNLSLLETQPQITTSPALGAPTVASIPPTTEVAVDSDYRVQLGQQAYVVPKGQPLTLSGKILREIGTHLTESELSVQLRDPQTAKVLFEIRQYLANQELPAPFKVELPQLPNLKTQVVLGAVTLQAKASEASAPVLALAAFTITAGLDQLLDAIANQDTVTFEEEISIYPGTTEPFVKPAESLSTLISPDLPLSPPTVRTLTPSLGLTLPPQLHESSTDSSPEKTPQLPPIPASKPTEQPLLATARDPADTSELITTELAKADATAEVTQHPKASTLMGKVVRVPALFESDSVEEDDLEAELAAAALDDDLEDPEELEALEDSARYHPINAQNSKTPVHLDDDYEAAYPEAIPESLETEAAVDPEFIRIDQSFQSLNLQERFWSKLTALTYEGYRAATELKSAMQAAGVKAALQTPGASSSSPAPAAASTETAGPQSPQPEVSPTPAVQPKSVNYEVVVYDTPPPNSSGNQLASSQTSPQKSAPPAEINPPILEVPSHELTAGDLVSIRIRLAQPQDYRPYVKVWMNDLQTRTLIDEPRLLMHFTPNQQGELETLMRVKIPLGCLEVQFAAITINMATLQESSKFVVNRSVVPPDLPSLSLDEFDL